MKRLMFGIAAGALVAGLGAALYRPGRKTASLAPVLSGVETRRASRNFLLYFIVPLWQAAGVADWLCHRRTKIAKTTGAKESLIHLLMLGEVGVPVLAALFLEINPAVLLLMIAAFLVHEVTALWDVSYAVTRREVKPIEQHVHSFLEMLPLMAVSFIAVLHWDQVRSIFRRRPRPDMRIRLKRDPLPTTYVVATLSGVVLLNLLPYLEELWRDWRAYPGRLTPPRSPKMADSRSLERV